MPARELVMGRTFGVTFDHGDDFFDALREFCRENDVRQGYIPMFLAGFSEAEIVGTCEKLADPNAPVWSSVHLESVEALGVGTITHDPEADQIVPHIHVALGVKGHSATGHTSHLLKARVLFLTEMLVVEVAEPVMRRVRNPDLYDVPLLTFES
jgi:predicted DNA-binding protein with PD1-like motif